MSASRLSLHLVTGPAASRQALVRAVTQALQGGADLVQVREKGAAAADLLATCHALGEALGGPGRLLVNDRVDIALAAGARGVHLAKKSLPPAAVRAIAPGLLLGVSVHSVAEAQAAARAGADYVTFGSIYPTGTHPGQPAQGPAALAAGVGAVGGPVLAIGGITPANAGAVAATGCAGIAVISAILDAADPRAATAALRRALDATPARPRFSFPPQR